MVLAYLLRHSQVQRERVVSVQVQYLQLPFLLLVVHWLMHLLPAQYWQVQVHRVSPEVQVHQHSAMHLLKVPYLVVQVLVLLQILVLVLVHLVVLVLTRSLSSKG
ncbi:hypothetical protein C1N60_11845 [Pantoea sp. SGAir0184]